MINEKVTIAVISDTHAHLNSSIAAIIKECDIAVHAGDICGEEILNDMHPKTGNVYAVAGNNDLYCHTSSKPLPEILSFDVLGEKITIEHGHAHGMSQPCHDSLRKAHADAKLIIYGHTHKIVVDKDKSPWILNPGAAGQVRTHGGPSCLVIECSAEKEWKITTHRFSEES